MASRIAFALGFAVAVSPVGIATGCGTSTNSAEDAGEGACVEAGGVCVTNGGVALCPNPGPKVCGAGAVCCVLGELTMRDASAE